MRWYSQGNIKECLLVSSVDGDCGGEVWHEETDMVRPSLASELLFLYYNGVCYQRYVEACLIITSTLPSSN